MGNSVAPWRRVGLLAAVAAAHATVYAVVAPRPAVAVPRAMADPRAVVVQQYLGPDVANQPLERALKTLNDQGFKAGPRSADGTNKGDRIVVETRPAAGSHGPVTKKAVVIAQVPPPPRGPSVINP